MRGRGWTPSGSSAIRKLKLSYGFWKEVGYERWEDHGQEGLEPDSKGLSGHNADRLQWNQQLGIWLPTLDTFRTFAA